MNATDFISEGEYKALKLLANDEKDIRFGRTVKMPNGNRYTIDIHSGRYWNKDGKGNYFVGIHFSRKWRCKDLTDGWAIDGGSYTIDFDSYEKVKEEINRVFRQCPDYSSAEQLKLF